MESKSPTGLGWGFVLWGYSFGFGDRVIGEVERLGEIVLLIVAPLLKLIPDQYQGVEKIGSAGDELGIGFVGVM